MEIINQGCDFVSQEVIKSESMLRERIVNFNGNDNIIMNLNINALVQKSNDDGPNDGSQLVVSELCEILNERPSVFPKYIVGSSREEVMTNDDLISASCSSIQESEREASRSSINLTQNRMRLALGVLVRLVLPLCNGVAKGWRGIRGIIILKALGNLRASRQMLTNMLAYAANTISMSLSSVQVHRIDPILKIMKLKKDSTAKCITGIPSQGVALTNNNSPSTTSNELITTSNEPENSVSINILAEPAPGVPIRADIVFIHGLHGSQVNTWKQGLWNRAGVPVDFNRPPRPPMRPPKRPRHSRSTHFLYCKKRPRYCNMESDFLFEQDELAFDKGSSDSISQDGGYDTEHSKDSCSERSCGDIEYSFSTFRFRMDKSESPPMSRSDSISFDSPKDCNNNNTAPELEKYSKCWPGDWLPLDCPGVRVIAINYTTDPYLWRPLWIKKRNRTNLPVRAREMTELLIKAKVGYGHPIVWVGHSKGGLFIKQIIVDAWESGRPAAAPLWKYSRGAFFYSVPHRGSPLADFNLPLLGQSIELTEIQRYCTGLMELHRRFVALYQSGNLKIDVFSFVETALTFMSVLYLRIVYADSADPGIGKVCGLHLDHREICKPRSRNCILYTELVKMINRVS